jgi:hypothetical protein
MADCQRATADALAKLDDVMMSELAAYVLHRRSVLDFMGLTLGSLDDGRSASLGGRTKTRRAEPGWLRIPTNSSPQRIRQVEDAAGLPKLIGGTCHPYRRKWRTERSHHPIKAVAVAGGWSDFDTMLSATTSRTTPICWP